MVCCSVLICYSVLQCVAYQVCLKGQMGICHHSSESMVCWSVLQCVAILTRCCKSASRNTDEICHLIREHGCVRGFGECLSVAVCCRVICRVAEFVGLHHDSRVVYGANENQNALSSGKWSTPTGWIRKVGSLKLHVSFAKEPYKRNHILQKRHLILRSLQASNFKEPTNRSHPIAHLRNRNIVWCVLQCVTVCCSVLQCGTVWHHLRKRSVVLTRVQSFTDFFTYCYSVLQCVLVWYTVLQCVAVCRSATCSHIAEVCCSVLQCVALLLGSFAEIKRNIF